MEKLKTCDSRLITLFQAVVAGFDCAIICGHRGKEDQNKAFAEGKSKLKFPMGKHNSIPSKAVDAMPFPIDWKDTDRIRYFAGYVKGVADTLGIPIRWGGDWDQDTELNDNNFNDLVHFELRF